MSLFKKIVIILFGCFILFGITLVCLYNFYLSPVDKSNDEKISVEILEKETFYSIGKKLYDNKLIKSEFFYKIYIKLNKPNNLQVGIYSLDKAMPLKEIVDILNGGSTYNPYLTNITIKEGNNIRKIASIVDEATDNSYDDFMNKP